MANGLSQSQRRTLFATIRAAAREQGEQPEAYRKRVMAEELGVVHLSQVSSTTGYDTLMARICRDAGDDANAIKYTLAGNRINKEYLFATGQPEPRFSSFRTSILVINFCHNTDYLTVDHTGAVWRKHRIVLRCR